MIYSIRKNPGFFSLIMAPAVLLVGGFVVFPVLNGVRLSFTDATPLSKKTNWVGFENYTFLFEDPEFWEVVRNSLFIVGASTIFAVVFGFGIALLLDKRVKGSNLFRTAIFQVWIVPWIAITILWGWLFHVDYGLINYILVSLGILKENLQWLFSSIGSQIVLIAGFTWRAIPFMMVVSLAALRSIPDDIREAASIDGAGYFKQVFFVVIPLLRNIILIMALLQSVRFFQEMTMPWVLTQGGPGNSTMVLSMYTYKLAFQNWDFGLASTVGTLWLGVLMIGALLYVKIFFRKID